MKRIEIAFVVVCILTLAAAALTVLGVPAPL